MSISLLKMIDLFFFNPLSRVCLLILEREEGGERERQTDRQTDIDVRENHQSVSSCMHPDQGLNLQPRYVP